MPEDTLIYETDCTVVPDAPEPVVAPPEPSVSEDAAITATPASVPVVPDTPEKTEKKRGRPIKKSNGTEKATEAVKASLSKVEVRSLLKTCKVEGTPRVNETGVAKATWKTLVAEEYIAKGPRGCWYLSGKALSLWPQIVDFDLSSKQRAAIKQYETGETPKRAARGASTKQTKKARKAAVEAAPAKKAGRQKNVGKAADRHALRIQKALQGLVSNLNGLMDLIKR